MLSSNSSRRGSMMSRAMLVATAILVTAVSAAAAPPPTEGNRPRLDLPIEGVIANPDWIARPSGDDVGRFYPTLAREMELQGRALLSCRVSALGSLEGCKAEGEIPVG